MGGNLPQVHDCETSELLIEGDVEFEDWLRLILSQSNGAEPGASAQEGLREIVFEADLDGMHYALVRSPIDLSEPDVSLSPRETEIVRLVCKGLANKTIAAVLDISPWTVATHLRRVFAKLQVNSRAEMVAQVFQVGLVGSDHHCYAGPGVECPLLCDT